MRTLVKVTLLLIVLYPLTTAGSEFGRAEVERQALLVLDQFMATFNARDPQAHVGTYHFPHYRLARGEMRVLETQAVAERMHTELFESLPETGWHRSVWIQRRIVTASETKVHVDTKFRRLREDGSEIGTYDSLYVLIKVNGRWGVKLRSSFL